MVLRHPVVHLLVSTQVRTPFSNITCIAPQAEEIRLEIITTAEISTSFHGSPGDFQTSFHGIAQDFKQVFTGANGSPLIIRENCIILEIRIFQV